MLVVWLCLVANGDKVDFKLNFFRHVGNTGCLRDSQIEILIHNGSLRRTFNTISVDYYNCCIKDNFTCDSMYRKIALYLKTKGFTASNIGGELEKLCRCELSKFKFSLIHFKDLTTKGAIAEGIVCGKGS